jgi:hypothetical protein
MKGEKEFCFTTTRPFHLHAVYIAWFKREKGIEIYYFFFHPSFISPNSKHKPQTEELGYWDIRILGQGDIRIGIFG